MKNKKALAPAVLVGLIMALLAMGIIFLFIKNFPGKEIIDKEACRQSVVIRSASLFGQQPGKSLAPLRCKTQDILVDYNEEVKVKQRIANAISPTGVYRGQIKHGLSKVLPPGSA